MPASGIAGGAISTTIQISAGAWGTEIRDRSQVTREDGTLQIHFSLPVYNVGISRASAPEAARTYLLTGYLSRGTKRVKATAGEIYETASSIGSGPYAISERFVLNWAHAGKRELASVIVYRRRASEGWRETGRWTVLLPGPKHGPLIAEAEWKETASPLPIRYRLLRKVPDPPLPLNLYRGLHNGVYATDAS